MNLKGTGLAGSFWRGKKNASHGSTVAMNGTPAASAASAIGLLFSGVEVARIRSTLSVVIRSLATWAAFAGSDWPSFWTIVIA